MNLGVHWRCGLTALAVGGAVLPAAASAGPAAPASTSTSTTTVVCKFGAFVKETDPAGLNVRQAPRTTAKILGTLPAVFRNPDLPGYAVKVEVDVLGVQQGWFLVEHARDNTALTGRNARPMFSGRGWVSGAQLTVKSQATHGFAEPRSDAAVAVKQADASSFDGDLFVDSAKLINCQGPWAQLEFNTSRWKPEDRALLQLLPAAQAGLPKHRFRAWFVEICGNQETTCDGTASREAGKR